MKRKSGSKPSLRISHIVRGRQARDRKGKGKVISSRVTYLVDPTGAGIARDIAEIVVLRRWRGRQSSGYAYSGARLKPNLWRALPITLGRNVGRSPALSLEEIRTARNRMLERLRKEHYSIPAPEILEAIIDVCGPRRLSSLVARHAAPEHRSRSGVPDLFLFARGDDGKVRFGRFVEVKKPEERVSPDQHGEIAFMQHLGLQARVLRLIERR